MTSKIEMHELAAKAFPDLLDFVYACTDDNPITADSSVALFYLGEYLGIEAIRSAVRAFWKNALKIDELAGCFEQCKILNLEKAGNEIIKHILKTLPAYNARFMAFTDDGFWHKMLRANDGKPSLGVWVAKYCMKQRDSMDASAFQELTKETVLPKLHLVAAITLLEVEQAIVPTRHGAKLSPLQNRCIEVVAMEWEADRSPVEDLSFIISAVLAKILTRKSELSKAQKTPCALCNSQLFLSQLTARPKK